jgi:hypothetical protein
MNSNRLEKPQLTPANKDSTDSRAGVKHRISRSEFLHLGRDGLDNDDGVKSAIAPPRIPGEPAFWCPRD